MQIPPPAAVREAGRWLTSGDGPGGRFDAGSHAGNRAHRRAVQHQDASRFRPSAAERPARDARHSDGPIPDQRLNARVNELASV